MSTLSEANVRGLRKGNILTIVGWWLLEGLSHFESNGGSPNILDNKQGHAVFELDGLELIFLGSSQFLNGNIEVQLYSHYLDELQFRKQARDLERWGQVWETTQ